MIIVPAEKQFTWRYAPLVLFSIVLLNVLIYFLYQSGDTQKLMSAAGKYEQEQFFEREWPIFVNYLEERQETSLLETYRENYKAQDYHQILIDMLMRESFYDYLQSHAANFFYDDFYDHWRRERMEIHDTIASVSYIANGVTPNHFKPLSLLTHQFLHGSIMHLLGNMFFLVVCGFAVEAAIGHWRFLLFYLVAGVVGGLIHAAMDWSSETPLVGASGAISGVMAMYLAVFRLKKIEFFYWFFFFVGYFRAPALLILPIYIGKEIYSYQSDPEAGVAFMAHAGGFIAGALLIGGALLLNRNMLNVDYIEGDESLDPDQQRLAEIYEAIEKFQFDKALTGVNQIIAQKGKNFDLAIVKYNLLKIQRGDEFAKAAIALLNLPQLTAIQVARLERVWTDNPEIHNQLTDVQAIKLGVQFTQLESPKAAEQLFLQLQSRFCTNTAMAVFAAKLAQAFAAKNDRQKKNHYEQLALSLGAPARPSEGV